MNQDIRWKQRFQNFKRSALLFNEIQDLDIELLSTLEKEGIIQRFEFTLELAWKTLKDKMEFDGIVLDKISSKMVVKEAFRSKYINNVEAWLNMIEDRNILSHTYDFSVFERIIPVIQSQYTVLINDLFVSLLEDYE